MAILDTTFGAYLIGAIIASVLWGCTCVQTWYYYTNYPSDRWYIKLLVACIFASDTVHQALITHVVYTYLITYFGDWAQLNNVVSSLIIEVLFNGFTALVVQSFLAMRVYTLSNKNVFLTGLVMVLVLLAWILNIFFCIKAINLETYTELATINNVTTWINAAAVAGDVLITISLCYFLQRSRTGFRRSNVTINKLIIFSISTGLLTSLDAIAAVISITLWPHSFACVAFYFCIGRLYCNSLLATLNARKAMRGGGTHLEDISLSNCTQQKTNHSFLETTSKHAPNNISIKIDTTEEYMQDEHYSTSSRELKNPDVCARLQDMGLKD